MANVWENAESFGRFILTTQEDDWDVFIHQYDLNNLNHKLLKTFIVSTSVFLYFCK